MKIVISNNFCSYKFQIPISRHVTCQLQRRADNYWGRQGDDDGDDDEDDADDEDDW